MDTVMKHMPVVSNSPTVENDLNFSKSIEEEDRKKTSAFDGAAITVNQDFTILIVDDSSINLRVLTDILDPIGYNLEYAYDGKTAIDKAIEINPDLILMDVMMPALDGYESCKLIKQNENLEDVPVIFLSALIDHTDKLKAFQVGGVDYIEKPFYANEVLARVSAQIKLYATTRALKKEINDRIRTEKALEASEERLQLALSAGNIGTWDWNLIDDTMIWDKHMFEIYDCNEDSFTSTVDCWTERLHPEDQQSVLNMIAHTLKGATKFEMKFRIQLQDGTIKHLQSSADVVYDEENSPVRMVGVNMDISNLKETQQSLEESLHKLKLSNDELENFAYIVTHDLHEPLRVISSYLYLLKRRVKDELSGKSLEFIDRSVVSAERMKKMISELLEYSKVDSKKLRFKPVCIEKIIDSTIEDMENLIHEVEAELKYNRLPTVKGDESQIRRVFMNLISNSIRYRHPERTPVIDISVEEIEANYQFSVSDNGLGIDQTDHQKAFEIFQTLRQDTTKETLGVGLAISKKIIEKHGGKIWFDPNYQKGTQIVFTLPKKSTELNEKQD